MNLRKFGTRTRMVYLAGRQEPRLYVCRFEGVATPNVHNDDKNDCQEGVAKSNSMSRGYGMKTTMSNNTAQGGPTTDQLSGVVNTTRISGAGIPTAGSNKSEKQQISGVEKDLG